MNKKAGIPDGIYFMIALVVIALCFLVGWKLMKEFDDTFQNSYLISPEGKGMVSSIRTRYVSVIDSSFLVIFVGFIIALAVSTWFIYTHPAMFWLSIPIFAFIVMLTAIYANMFQNIAYESFLTEIVDFPIMSYIMGHYVYFIVGVIVILAITLYAKPTTIQP